MVCIYCTSQGHGQKDGTLAVTNSRPQKSRNQTWRRRLCKACGAVFTSIEAIDLSQALIVMESPYEGRKAARNELRPFDRDKLFVSLYKSLQHRPTAISDARELSDTVVARLVLSADRSGPAERGLLSAQTIAGMALQTLRRFDAAAATHYAAFHAL